MSKDKEKQKNNKQKKQDTIFYIVVTSIILVLLITIGIAYFITQKTEKEDTKILGYTELIKYINENSPWYYFT